MEQHPAMIALLDNQYSVGKDSELAPRAAQRSARQPARTASDTRRHEILELHTLGVNGGYTQADVTSFAQILTGRSIGGGKGRLARGLAGRFYFRENLHEPGAKTCLGKNYYEGGPRQGSAGAAAV